MVGGVIVDIKGPGNTSSSNSIFGCVSVNKV